MSEQKPLLFTVFVEVQPDRTKEFNEWYNGVHVPEVVVCPGFLRSVRYEEVGAEGKFMAMYELTGLEALESEGFGKARGWKEMQPVVKGSSSALWRHIYTAPPGKGAKGGDKATLLRFNRSSAQAEHDAEFNKWYNEEHLTELLDCPGWLRASRYEALRGDYQYLATYDLAGDSAMQSPEYFKARGFKSVEPYVTGASILAYREIFRWEG